MATSRSDPKPAPAAGCNPGHCEAQGQPLYWQACGERGRLPALPLHHGLGSSPAWRRHLPAPDCDGWCAIAYDQWGYGASDLRPGCDPPGFTTDIHDLLTLLDELGVQPVALIGHSDGVTIALYLAALPRARVSALVVVAAHTYLEPIVLPAIQAAAHSFGSDRRFGEGLRCIRGEKVESVFRNCYQSWQRPQHPTWDERLLLSQVCCPTLVRRGEADEYAFAQHAQDLTAAVQGAERRLVSGGHHTCLTTRRRSSTIACWRSWRRSLRNGR